MVESTTHRGPDASGVFVSTQVSLGHNRLRIIDLSERASQPMRSASGRFSLVFNGEIYNYRELRAELSYPFKSESDTEVILALFERYGTDALKRLQGIFALGVHDSESNEIILARDPLGVKPLVYTVLPSGGLVFASEAKSLLEHDIPRRINRQGLGAYLTLQYVPGVESLIEGIRKLPPGTMLRWREGRLALESFVPPEPQVLKRSRSEEDELIRSTIYQAVISQLVSDRPVGIFLSGGIDSTVLLNCVARRGIRLKTFSLGFELEAGEQPDKFNADLALARKNSQFYGTEHSEYILSAQDFQAALPRIAWHIDDPVGNPTTVAMWALSKQTKGSVDVALNGSGGDELFGGYPRYQKSLLLSAYGKIPAFLRRYLDSVLPQGKAARLSGAKRYARFMFRPEEQVSSVLMPGVFSMGTLYSLFQSEFEVPRSPHAKCFDEIFPLVDRKFWLVDESLTSLDRMSMAAALEVRVPLLDQRVVALADSIPHLRKVSMRDTKIALKRAFRDELPQEILAQPKRGWFSPFSKWMRRKEFYEFAQDVVRPEFYSTTAELFNWKYLRSLMEEHRSGRGYHPSLLYSMIILQLWQKRFQVTL